MTPPADRAGPTGPSTGLCGTWDWDIPANVLRADDEFARLYGLDAAAAAQGLPTSAFFQAIHPDDRPRIRISVAGILAGAELFSKEFRIVTPGGETVWVHARGMGRLDDNDEPVRFTGLLLDVTERKRTEERLRIIQSAGGIGTFEYVDGFATATVSEDFCNLLGLHPAAVLPVETINGVVQDNKLLIPSHRERLDQARLDAEFRICRNDDGETRWIARRGEIIQEGNGYRLIGVIYDVTVAKTQEEALRELNDNLETRVDQEVAIRQKAEDALRQAQKMEAVGQLTGGIAHDFNNLLMAITSSLSLLEKRVPTDPQALRLIENAQQGAQRGAALTQRMLAFARRQDLVSESIDVPALVADMRVLVERTIGPAWSFELDFPNRLPPVLADANQLELALLNLAVNARDAMPGGGVIRVSAERRDMVEGERGGLASGPYIGLSVIDTGDGMDAATLERATEPFFTTKGIGKGTGLGLSMIHGLAQQLDGSFTLRSSPDEGTTATLWLPVADPDAVTAPTRSVQEMSPHKGSLKVLAVDDDFLILMNTAALLEDLGHEALEASSGEAALALAHQHPDIDIIISDQAMPNMRGTQLADHVTALRGDIPFILASGYGEVPEGSQQRIVKLGKPFDLKMLEQAIAQAMSKSKTPT